MLFIKVEDDEGDGTDLYLEIDKILKIMMDGENSKALYNEGKFFTVIGKCVDLKKQLEELRRERRRVKRLGLL